MLGYYSNPEKTAAAIRDGWFHTGDLGAMDIDGYIRVAGRKSNLIITKNGEHIQPEGLETLLNGIPYISDCLIWGECLDNSENPVITAVILEDAETVAAKLGKGYTDEGLEQLLKLEIDNINLDLPPYMHINRLILRKDKFLKNSLQKIIRYAPSNKGAW